MDEWSENKKQICKIVGKMRKNRLIWFGYVMRGKETKSSEWF